MRKVNEILFKFKKIIGEQIFTKVYQEQTYSKIVHNLLKNLETY